MRVTLINPPRFLEFAPNLGILYVASVLEKAGHEAAIVDKPINTIAARTWDMLDASFKKTVEEVLRTDPELIGMTVTCHTSYALELLEIFKRVLPKAHIVVGGPQVTFIPEDVLSSYAAIDFVIRGEGEQSMLKLVSALEQNLDLTEIEGLSYRSNGKVINNRDAPLIQHLDKLPYPARHMINLEEYPEDTRITLISSRGCPHNCIFCSSQRMWRGYRAREVQKVIEELMFLKQRYSPKRVNFVDDTFVVSKERTIRLCQGIRKEGLDVVWSAMTRVGLGRELLGEMHSAGGRVLYLGCESGDDSTLRTVTKGITANQIESTVKMALEIGFQVTCSFVINFPFETPERARTTIRFAKKLKSMGAQIQAHMLAPYPGTPIYDNMDQYNLTPKHQGRDLWKIMSHPLYLEDRPPEPILSNNVISEQELAKLWSEVTSSFDFY